jgi:rubredoxin
MTEPSKAICPVCGASGKDKISSYWNSILNENIHTCKNCKYEFDDEELNNPDSVNWAQK